MSLACEFGECFPGVISDGWSIPSVTCNKAIAAGRGDDAFHM
jgi:hypothetical protein